MLTEILRRLPLLPSLARAAFACPRLRSPVASPFISPPQLMGYFILGVRSDIPSILLRSDRDVASIVRRGDFQLTGFEDYH
jgi:hypothetical protein